MAGKPATRYTPQNFNNMVKARARTARLPDGSRLPGAERYTAHSVRSGADGRPTGGRRCLERVGDRPHGVRYDLIFGIAKMDETK